MDKVLKPFVVLTTYVVLYALTYSVISAIVSALFWTNYFEVVNHWSMKLLLVLAIASHSLYALIESDSK
jgi:hypothetical protein